MGGCVSSNSKNPGNSLLRQHREALPNPRCLLHVMRGIALSQSLSFCFTAQLLYFEDCECACVIAGTILLSHPKRADPRGG